MPGFARGANLKKVVLASAALMYHSEPSYLATMGFHSEAISLRPVAPGDEEFLFAVYASSRGDDLESLGWSSAQIREFLESHRTARSRDPWRGRLPAA